MRGLIRGLKMKISLIMPVSRFYSADSTSVPPYALLYIGTALKRAGFDVDLYHENGNVDNVANKVLKNDNLLVGISAFTGYPVWLACQYAKRLKERRPGIKIVLGGYHASMLTEQCLSDEFFDFIVFGEGEETAVELAEALKSGVKDFSHIKGLGWKDQSGKKIINEPRQFPANIDFDIDWSLLNIGKYVKRVAHLGMKKYFYIFSSRGCPYDCSFCAGSFLHNRRYRKETPEHVISQYRPLLDEHGIELVEYLDDNFFVDLKWAESVAKGIGRPYRALIRLDKINEEVCDLLNRTDCRAIFVGVESGNEHMRNDIIRKKLGDKQIYDAVKMLAKKCPKINVSAMFIAGVPGEKYEEFRDTCKMAVNLSNLHSRLLPQINVYTPYPMCTSYLDAVKMGWNPPQRTEEWDLDPKPGRALDPTWLDYYGPKTTGKFELTSKMFVLLRRDAGLSFFKDLIRSVLRVSSVLRLTHDIYAIPLEINIFWYFYMRMIKHDVC